MSIEVYYEGRTIELTRGETVLEGFERAGIAAPSSCRAGVCQFCMMRVVDGAPPPRSQDGLKDSLKKNGYFLTCISHPEESFSCEPAYVTPFRGWVSIREIQTIGPDIAAVRFERPTTFAFTPGQFVTLRREDGIGRSYSIASRADDEFYFDIHVRHIPKGRMSSWLHCEARSGDQLWAEGPKGDCMYYPGQSDETLNLVGTGTGMAPLFAIAEDAIRQGHVGTVTIYQGALSEDRLYLVDEFTHLATRHSNVRYIKCLFQGRQSENTVIGDLKKLVLSRAAEPKSARVYLCGDPGLVRDLKRQLFLQGVSLRRIHSDPFIGTEDVAIGMRGQ